MSLRAFTTKLTEKDHNRPVKVLSRIRTVIFISDFLDLEPRLVNFLHYEIIGSKNHYNWNNKADNGKRGVVDLLHKVFGFFAVTQSSIKLILEVIFWTKSVIFWE